MDHDELLKRITRNPKILGGKPIVRGTRLSVEIVLEALASGVSHDELLKDYPFLEPADVQACLLYAASTMGSQPAA